VIHAKIPAILYGPPGVGKSAAIQALGKRLQLPVYTVIASIREPADFSGLPILRDDGVWMMPPRWAQALAEAGQGILFLDEITTTPPAVQAALLRVVLDRVVGDLALPPGVAVLAAANPVEQAAGGWDLSAPLANRFLHLEWTLDPAAWSADFPTYWGDPPEIPGIPPDRWAAARALVAGFIRHAPQYLLQVPKDVQISQAWPSPRTWEFVSRILAVAPPTEQLPLILGAVGSAAHAFWQWKAQQDLPDPAECLTHPTGWPIPPRGDQLFAVLQGIVAIAQVQQSAETWERAWECLGYAADQGHADVALPIAETLAKLRQPEWPFPTQAFRSLAPVLSVLNKVGV